jgi:hypothetical protein
MRGVRTTLSTAICSSLANQSPLGSLATQPFKAPVIPSVLLRRPGPQIPSTLRMRTAAGKSTGPVTTLSIQCKPDQIDVKCTSGSEHDFSAHRTPARGVTRQILRTDISLCFDDSRLPKPSSSSSKEVAADQVASNFFGSDQRSFAVAACSKVKFYRTAFTGSYD